MCLSVPPSFQTQPGTIPVDADENEGAKIWLVLAGDYDVDANEMSAWNQPEYLFENNLITYDDTDEE